MAPSVAFPLAVPFTDHVMAVLVNPVTDAENVCVSPSRTLAIAGVVVTLGVVGPGLPVKPAQPALAMQSANSPSDSTSRCLGMEISVRQPHKPAHRHNVATNVPPKRDALFRSDTMRWTGMHPNQCMREVQLFGGTE